MEKLYLDFEPEFIRRNVLRFDEDHFISAIKDFVQDKYLAPKRMVSAIS